MSKVTLSFAKAPQMIRELFIVAARYTPKNVLQSHASDKRVVNCYCETFMCTLEIERQLLGVAAKYIHCVFCCLSPRYWGVAKRVLVQKLS